MKKKEIKIPGLIVPKVRGVLYTKYGNGFSITDEEIESLNKNDSVVDCTRYYDVDAEDKKE